MSHSARGVVEQLRAGVGREAWLRRSCPACGRDESRASFEKFNVSYVCCSHCGTTYIDPAPPPALLKELYDETGERVHGDVRRSDLDFRPSRYWREEALVWPRGGRLLDIGCATGSFLQRAQDIGFDEVHGIDISAPDIEYARSRGFNAICGDVLERPFEAESFDAVTCWATLEHVADPLANCTEAWRLLKPGGTFALSVPSGEGVSFSMLGRRWHMVGLDHLNYFTRSGMRQMLERAEFASIQMVARSFNPLAFIRDLRGRHTSGELTDETLVAESVEIAGLRQRRWVSTVEKSVDLLVRSIGKGDLLLATARKSV